MSRFVFIGMASWSLQACERDGLQDSNLRQGKGVGGNQGLRRSVWCPSTEESYPNLHRGWRLRVDTGWHTPQGRHHQHRQESKQGGIDIQDCKPRGIEIKLSHILEVN